MHPEYTALDVAKGFVHLAYDGDFADVQPFTNLKVNALLYYAQVYSYMLDDQPLFSEPLEATATSVIVPSVYDYFSKYGFDDIPPSEADDRCISEDMWWVHEDLACYASHILMDDIVDKQPWQEARKGSHCIITKEMIRSYVHSLEECPQIEIKLNLFNH